MSLKNIFRKITGIASAVTLMCLGSCIADDIIIDNEDQNSQGENVGKPLEGDGPFYFSFRLQEAGGVPYTRAENNGNPNNQNFQYGSANEYAILNYMILFFDDAGKQIFHLTESNQSNSKESKDTLDIERIYQKTLRIELGSTATQADSMKAVLGNVKSLVFIANYDPSWLTDEAKKNDLYSRSLRETAQTGTSIYEYLSDNIINNIEGKKGFLMTTAGRFVDDEESYGSYTYCNLVESGEDIFKASAQAAEANPVEITIERLAARVDFTLEKKIELIEVLYNTDVYGLEFIPDKWGFQVQEKDEYLFKHQESLSYYEGNSYPSDFQEWINYYDVTIEEDRVVDMHRTFWAHSPHYSNGTYPAKGDGSEINLSLQYTKYSQITGELQESMIGNTTYLKGSLYTTERTFLANELSKSQTENPYAVPTSVVLTGSYSPQYLGTDEINKEPIHPKQRDLEGENVEVVDEDEGSSGQKKQLDKTDLGNGFYIRFIDMERTDKETTPSKQYQYRLYLKNGKDGKDELEQAMLREQVEVCTREEKMINVIMKDEEGNIVKDEFGDPKTDKKRIWVYTPIGANSSDTLKALLKLDNSHQRLDGNYFVNASNTYALFLTSTDLDDSNEELFLVSRGPNDAVQKDTEGNVIFQRIVTTEPDNSASWNAANGETAQVSVAEANKQLQRRLGYAQYYYQGKAFFYAPILHYTGSEKKFGTYQQYSGLLNYTRDLNTGKYITDLETGRYNFSHNTGDFGVVRNNLYNFTINRISVLGYGIPSLDYYPLPEPRLEHDIYYFDMELKILPWTIFQYTFDI